MENNKIQEIIINKLVAFSDFAKRNLKKLWNNLKFNLKFLAKSYPFFSQTWQLTVLYLYALINLTFSIKNCIGFYPESLARYFPYGQMILKFPIFQFISTPEKAIIIYLTVMDNVLSKKNVTLIVKYNLFLLFILEMVNNLIISTWDLFVHRNLREPLDDEFLFSTIGVNDFMAILYMSVLTLYAICYITALTSRFIKFPGPFSVVTDSVAFWLKMPYRNKKPRIIEDTDED